MSYDARKDIEGVERTALNNAGELRSSGPLDYAVSLDGSPLSWWRPGVAGLAAETLAGLAGVGMLELHCPNFEAAHLLVRHVGVLLVSGGLGAMWAWGMPAALTTPGTGAKRNPKRLSS